MPKFTRIKEVSHSTLFQILKLKLRYKYIKNLTCGSGELFDQQFSRNSKRTRAQF